MVGGAAGARPALGRDARTGRPPVTQTVLTGPRPPGPVAAARSRPDPYWYAAGVVLLLSVAFAIRHPWSGDLGIHLATIDRLRASLVRPGNPLVDAPGPSAYDTPYTVLLALAGRATGWDTITVFAAAGPVVVAVLLWGLRAFVTTLSPRRYAPLLALLSVLLLWGPRPRVWSGFFQLWSLPLTAAYPSTLALALTLLLWTALSRTLDRPPAPARYLGPVVLAAVLALTHPFTFAIAALGAVALVVARIGTLSRVTWAWLGAALAGWLALVAAWPYYPFLALFGATPGLDDIHRSLYDRPWLYYGLVVVALPALWLRARRNPRDPLVLLTLAAVALVVVGGLTGRYALGRMQPAAILAAQLALAIELAAPAVGMARRTWAAAAGLALLAGVAVQGAHLLDALPRAWVPHGLARYASNWPDYSWVARYLRPGDVVVTDNYAALRTLPGYGAKTIPPAWPDPFLPDQRQRWSDLWHIHAAQTGPAARAALLAKYHAAWVLEFPGSWSICAGQVPVTVGPQGQRLYRVPQS
jgi:hypothetical protein